MSNCILKDKCRCVSEPSLCPNWRSHIDRLVKDAVARFNALSPEQQREHRRAQRKSWVIGEMMLDHPDMTREEAGRHFDALDLSLARFPFFSAASS